MIVLDFMLDSLSPLGLPRAGGDGRCRRRLRIGVWSRHRNYSLFTRAPARRLAGPTRAPLELRTLREGRVGSSVLLLAGMSAFERSFHRGLPRAFVSNRRQPSEPHDCLRQRARHSRFRRSLSIQMRKRNYAFEKTGSFMYKPCKGRTCFVHGGPHGRK